MNWIGFASASSFFIKTSLLPSCLFGFRFPISVTLSLLEGSLSMSCKRRKTTWKWLSKQRWADVKSIDFSIPLLSQSLTVVVFSTLRAWLQHLREWDQSPGAEPVRVTAEALLPVLDLHRLRQPGCQWRRVPRCSVWWRGGSSGHCPCCCNWGKGCFRWQWWKWLSNYLNLKIISFKNDFWMNEQVNEELACVTIC